MKRIDQEMLRGLEIVLVIALYRHDEERVQRLVLADRKARHLLKAENRTMEKKQKSNYKKSDWFQTECTMEDRQKPTEAYVDEGLESLVLINALL